MQSSIFRQWLAEQGWRFDQQEHHNRGEGPVMVTVYRKGRKTEAPLGGSHEALDARMVRAWLAGLSQHELGRAAGTDKR